MMRLLRKLAVCLALAATTVGCQDELPVVTTLQPDGNPILAGDPLNSPQPRRARPRNLCVAPDGRTAWVTLPGTEDAPGTELAVVDLGNWRLLRRIKLPGAPWACAVHPSGRFVVVTLRFSDHAVVLETASDREVLRVPVPYYTELPLFDVAGTRLWLTNRWKDSVLSWDVAVADDFEVTRTNYDNIAPDEPMGTPVSDNPSAITLSSDGARLFVGSLAGLTTAVLDTATGALIDTDSDPGTQSPGAPTGINHIDFHSPVGGLAVAGKFLFIADTGPGTGSHPTLGRDLNDDGKPGDGTANVIFQDLQNEIAVVDTATFKLVGRYTSDSLCCKDFRDVDPDMPNRGQLLPLPDTWLPEVVAWLPPKSTWIVAGALPEAMVASADRLWVAFAGSNDVQSFHIDANGVLTPQQVAGGLYRTGLNPKALVLAAGRVVTVDRLGEALTRFDPAKPPGNEQHLVVGDVTGGPFPATDAEIGEAINEMTAAFTIDGDQTCVHCHRDNGAVGRPIVMPLQTDRLWGARNIMAQRGLYDTRPWFIESSMDETNFFPVLNEFTRKENFCCEGVDPTVWAKYPSVAVCAADPAKTGCNHVLHCTDDPPPECAARPYAKTPFLKRSAFIRDAAMRLFGRDTTVGDVLSRETVDAKREPLPLDFDGITRAIGLFMLRTPRLLPNPNRGLDLPSARRGKLLFQDPNVGCNSCHPLPVTSTATLPQPFSPSGMPVRFPPVITPTLAPDGSDVSRVTAGFIGSFPQTLQGPEGLRIGATELRGIWDRPRRLFHDGRARSLPQALATPGHAILKPGEPGFNERYGSFDTHGGTSQLSKYQLYDLINFLLTL